MFTTILKEDSNVFKRVGFRIIGVHLPILTLTLSNSDK